MNKTPSQTVGPYYTIGLCRRTDNELVAAGDPEAIVLRGELLDGDGVAITDGMVEVWQPVERRWGRSGTHPAEDRPGGTFAFVVSKPEAPAGQAPHLDVLVFARGLLKHQWTRMYFPDETEANVADPVLASLSADERARLIASREDGGLRFDIHMQGPQETVFFAL